jgi:hypothetical protein
MDCIVYYQPPGAEDVVKLRAAMTGLEMQIRKEKVLQVGLAFIVFCTEESSEKLGEEFQISVWKPRQ